ncbi:MAG: hypothetical protein KC613_24995, partial [Myxococcales bacterium]|nr:hypothetical protein [Myxococcales bacterium]
MALRLWLPALLLALAASHFVFALLQPQQRLVGRLFRRERRIERGARPDRLVQGIAGRAHLLDGRGPETRGPSVTRLLARPFRLGQGVRLGIANHGQILRLRTIGLHRRFVRR